jgi:glutamate-1-semialdehyde 2,1-aminomutase
MPDMRAPGSDAALRARAARVIPGGLRGHMRAQGLPPGYPRFFARAEGCRLWDADGREFIDFMCSWGPIVLGHHDVGVEAAAEAQRRAGDVMNGPAPVLVELAETFTGMLAHADWALFAKNGTDATTICVTSARAATGRRKLLVARGAYHGAAPWCSVTGVTAEVRAHLLHYRYNHIASLEQAAALCGDDLAAVLVSPFRHDYGIDQELADPAFAHALRALCERTGAALILDEVRTGGRIDLAGSWESLGVRPDLCAWSKAIANGHALASVTGNDRFRVAAASIFVTGSFWCGAVAMAAAHGFRIRQSGPPQMPMLLFEDDPDAALGSAFCALALQRGVYLHPRHNMFLSLAHRAQDIDRALEATNGAFESLARR